MFLNKLMADASLESFTRHIDLLNLKISQMPVNAGYWQLRNAFVALDEAKSELLIAGILKEALANDQ